MLPKVAIVGRPNVGKSTLMNNVVGEKIAIMSDKPQTTRNTIQAVYTDEECQMVFLDTPGIHKPKNKLGEKMAETIDNAVSEVDLILYVIEATDKGIGMANEFILNKVKNANTKSILVINKVIPLCLSLSKLSWQFPSMYYYI